MKLAIVGSGYVGLTTGACFAEMGNSVVCIDNDANKIKMLQQGEAPFFEPGLPQFVRSNVAEGRLSFSTSILDGIRKAQAVFISVGTPPLPDGTADARDDQADP